MNRADSPWPHAHRRGLNLSGLTLGPESAPVVLVLHGITASHRYWLPRIVPLARHFRLIVPDLPGFGASPKPFTDYTMELFVETLSEHLVQEGVSAHGTVHLVGHSLGALIALEVAANLGARAGAAVLLNLPRFPDAETAHHIMVQGSASYRRLLTVNTLAADFAQVRRAGWRFTARYLRRLPWNLLRDTRRFTFRSLSSTLENCLLHYRLEPVLERLPRSLNLLLIHGAIDPVAPLEPIRELTRHAPYPQLHVIGEAAHNPFHTHTAECLKLIDAFLGSRLARQELGA